MKKHLVKATLWLMMGVSMIQAAEMPETSSSGEGGALIVTIFVVM